MTAMKNWDRRAAIWVFGMVVPIAVKPTDPIDTKKYQAPSFVKSVMIGAPAPVRLKFQFWIRVKPNNVLS